MLLTRPLLPVLAALVFLVCALLAAGSVGGLLSRFASEAGISPLLLILVPGLFAMMFALLVYQGAATQVRRVGQSLSRGLLIALLTWIAFSALAAAVWCPPDNFAACLSGALIVSGIIGGGPMLIAALAAGYLSGLLVLRYRRAAGLDREEAPE